MAKHESKIQNVGNVWMSFDPIYLKDSDKERLFQDVDGMRAALKAVQDPENWKQEIKPQKIRGDAVMITVAAIEYFCGSETYLGISGNAVYVSAPGYYQRVGA